MLLLLQKSQQIFDQDHVKYAYLQVDMNNEKTINAIKICVSFRVETFSNNEDELPSNDRMKTLGEAVGYLWDLKAIQGTFECRGEIFSFPDNMDYFFNKAELLYLSDFHPNKED